MYLMIDRSMIHWEDTAYVVILIKLLKLFTLLKTAQTAKLLQLPQLPSGNDKLAIKLATL